ncbi:hypothetical protein [Streptomyces sp. NPDC002644]
MNTTLRSPVPPEAEDAAPPVKAPGGLAWAVFRLHRWALWAWIAYVALAAGILLWAWGPAANELASLAGACDLGGRTEPACARHVYQALETYQEFMRLGFFAVFGAPFLVGAWAAAAPTAREMETGTAELAWTQSVTPARWLTAKLALPAVAATAGMTLLLGLYRFAHQEGAASFTAIRHWTPSWWNEDLFTMLGVVMVPRVLCAVAVGVLLGLLLKRSLASLGTGLALLAASTFAVTLGRAYLWPREIRFAKAETADSPYLSHNGSEWQITTGAVTESGELAGDAGETAGYACMDEGYRDDRVGFDADAFYSCLKDEGYTDIWVAFHNESDRWPLQFVESGLWLAVAVAAVVLSYRLLRRRTAA